MLPGQEGSGDEGTAMLEIIHDLAPNAELGFATAFTSAALVRRQHPGAARHSGCDVIVDDVIYFDESPFQDGPIAQAVNDVTADGALYFSSAGNEGNTHRRHVGQLRGRLQRARARRIGKFAGIGARLRPGRRRPGLRAALRRERRASSVHAVLGRPAGRSRPTTTTSTCSTRPANVTDFSQDVQDGDDDPFEILQTGAGTGQRLAVVKFSGADRYFQLSAFRGRYADSADGLTAYTTPGITRGHSATVNAFSVAAAPAADPLPFDLEAGDPPNPAGPFPGVFTRQQLPERFTSDGPRRVFFEADGTPITPGDSSSTGGVVRQKPDITAADGVQTTVARLRPVLRHLGGGAARGRHRALVAVRQPRHHAGRRCAAP